MSDSHWECWTFIPIPVSFRPVVITNTDSCGLCICSSGSDFHRNSAVLESPAMPPRTYSRLPWHSCPSWTQKFTQVPGQCPCHAGLHSPRHAEEDAHLCLLYLQVSAHHLWVCSNAVEILRLHQNAFDLFRHQKCPILCGGVTLAAERPFSLILKVQAASLGNFWWCFKTFTVKIFFLISYPNVALSDFLWVSISSRSVCVLPGWLPEHESFLNPPLIFNIILSFFLEILCRLLHNLSHNQPNVCWGLTFYTLLKCFMLNKRW